MTFQDEISKRLEYHTQQLRDFERDRLQKEIDMFEDENPETIY